MTGEANFVMEQTGLTVGGFTQPAVARALIELPSNIEKGLSTRFLWIFPKPCYAKFESLEPVDKEFKSALGIVSCLIIVVPYTRKIWRGIKCGGLAVYITTAKLKAAKISYSHIHIW